MTKANRRPANSLTQERLREVLNYDPETGVFTWRIDRGKCVVGRTTGCIGPHGYALIGIENNLYRAHRLAWLYMTGAWPSEHIDHINRIRHDNRWSNLRLASRLQQSANTKIRSTNKSGYRGVIWYKRDKNWRAEIGGRYNKKHLGYFDTAEEAAAAYAKAAKEFFGEFASSIQFSREE